MKLSKTDTELIKLKEKVEIAMIKNSQKRLKDIKSTSLCAKLRNPSRICHSSSVQIQ